MAITYVGGQTQSITASTATNTTITFSLTGGLASAPAADDVVIVGYAVGAQSDRAIGVVTSGYTEALELYANSTNDTNLDVSYKVMGSTPDTSVEIGPTGNGNFGGFVVIHVFRGVDTATPLDVAPTTATSNNSAVANPPAITPANDNAVLVAFGAAGSTGGALITGSTDLSNFLAGRTTAYTYDITAGGGWITGPAAGVSYDPAAFTVSGSSASFSWCAATLALREQPTVTYVDASATFLPEATTTTSAQRIAEGAASIAVTATTSADLVQVLPTGSYGAGLFGVGPYNRVPIDGAATVGASATVTASGERVALGASTMSPAVTTTVAAQRVAQGATQISPAATTTMAGLRVALGLSVITPEAAVASSAQRVALGAAQIGPALALSASPEPLSISGSVTIAALVTTTAVGRLFWEAEANQSETWTEQAEQAEVWTPQGNQSEAWAAQSAQDETWTPQVAAAWS